MAKAFDQPSLYDTDHVARLAEQVAHLRAGRLAAVDLGNVAEELEGLMRSQRQQLENRLEVLILHRLKWGHQPDQRSNRGRASAEEQRSRSRRLLRDSPSLKREVAAMCQDVFGDALRAAVIETRISESSFPRALPCPIEQILERELPAHSCPSHG